MEPWAGGLEEQGHSPRATHKTRERQRPTKGTTDGGKKETISYMHIGSLTHIRTVSCGLSRGPINIFVGERE